MELCPFQAASRLVTGMPYAFFCFLAATFWSKKYLQILLVCPLGKREQNDHTLFLCRFFFFALYLALLVKCIYHFNLPRDWQSCRDYK